MGGGNGGGGGYVPPPAPKVVKPFDYSPRPSDPSVIGGPEPGAVPPPPSAPPRGPPSLEETKATGKKHLGE
jgi:hypothetical protein